MRAQTIIGNSSAPNSYSYTFGDGFQPVEDADGDFWVVKSDATGSAATYSVAAAWARDAGGKDVPTHYEIQGNSLVQVISPPADATYPIVADPTWEWYDFTYGVGFDKKETKHLASYGAAVGMCAAFTKWKALLAACGVAGGDWFFQARRAANNGKCIFISVAPPVAVFWTSKGCK